MKVSKLSQLINVFNKNHLVNQAVRSLQDFEILREYLPKIFPDADRVTKLLTILPPRNDKAANKAYFSGDLPRHTRDNKWLAKYVAHLVKANSQPGDYKVRFSNVQKFVEIDPEFDMARNDYEQNVVRAEIQKLMTPLYIQDYEGHWLTQYKINNSTTAEEAFREEVSKTMKDFGINPFMIEAGLENHADLWREQKMQTSFENLYLRPLWAKQGQMDFDQYQEIINQVAPHRDNWVALREKQYYENHKEIIDNLGLATENMKISAQEAVEKDAIWQNHYQNITAPLFYKASLNNQDNALER